MRVPTALQPLVDEGLIDEVIRPLQSGKEADVYLVETAGDVRVAKVYKEASKRSFRQRADYTEGRGTRRSRDARALKKGSRYGKAQKEAAWQTAEVDTLYRLVAADVRVPEPYAFHEGVLVMELVKGANGEPAPRLWDARLNGDQARRVHELLVRYTVRMLCCGVVHGDLSEYNVLLAADGPVIIDLPQAVDPAMNRNAERLFKRDARNLSAYLGRYAPELRRTRYGEEIWDLYERAELEPESPLTGRFKRKSKQVDLRALQTEIREAAEDAPAADPRIADAIAELQARAKAREEGRDPDAPEGPSPRSGKRRRRRGGKRRSGQDGQAQGRQAQGAQRGKGQSRGDAGQAQERRPSQQRRRRRGGSGQSGQGERDQRGAGPRGQAQQGGGSRGGAGRSAEGGEGGGRRRRRKPRRRGASGPEVVSVRRGKSDER